MTEILLSSAHSELLRGRILSSDAEGCAVSFTNQLLQDSVTRRLLVADVEIAKPADYSLRGSLEAELKPEFVARVTERAQRDNHGLLFVHSHIGVERPSFSAIDDEGERRLAEFLQRRHPIRRHAAMVMSAGGTQARGLSSDEYMKVIEIGAHRHVLSDTDNGLSTSLEAYDRQIRAFGAHGQRQLANLHVAIVGLGGTGSLIVQQLAHLGVRSFILIDPDVIEASNLNRITNASLSDVGRLKTAVAADYLFRIAPNIHVEQLPDSIIRAHVARRIADVDFIFGCTDSHGSRSVLQQVAYQYLVPCIDMGTTIDVKVGRVTHVYGRVQLLAPGLPCLTCSNVLDPHEVRRDMMTVFERQADPYLRGAREPAPAVISLNSTVASLAVTMFLASVAGFPGDARHLLYNAIAGTVRVVRPQQDPTCLTCSSSGALARGDSWPLMARQD